MAPAPPDATTAARTPTKAKTPARAKTPAKAKAGRPAPAIARFAVVIGAMKSGTSTLFDYLGQHPELAKSRHKEVNFFSGEKWRQGRDFYLRQWPGFDPAVHRYALEASPQYAKKPRAAQRMRDFGAEFRYLFIARNPVDRIESHLAHNIAGGRLPFELGLDHKMVETALQASRYAAALDAFRATLGDPKLLILDFDELKRAPLALAGRAAGFLELDPSFRFSPIPPVNVRKTANRADEFRLAPEQRAALAEALRDDVTAFRDRYGFDVGGWGIV